MSNKTIENIFIIMLIGIIVCLLLPIVQKISDNSQLSSIESSAKGNMESVKMLYTDESLQQEIALPFTVEYYEGGYNVYSANQKIEIHQQLTEKGRNPISGIITINSDGSTSVTDLKYEKYNCSKSPNGKIKCQRNS